MTEYCETCGKPVYFAEKRTSFGNVYHPQCLKCHNCSKILHPGQHSQHGNMPFCDIPCYAALFGPKCFGRGTDSRRYLKRSEGGLEEQRGEDAPEMADQETPELTDCDVTSKPEDDVIPEPTTRETTDVEATGRAGREPGKEETAEKKIFRWVATWQK